MLFFEPIFLLIFFPASLGLYYLVARRLAFRQWLLIFASLVFYGYWDIRFVPLLVASILANYALAASLTGDSRRLLAPLGFAVNLALLGYFKYRGFFLESLSAFSGDGFSFAPMILPLGISFFTFQQISYLVDLSHKRAPLYGFRQYALFVTFFPQLVAGPIVRHNELIPQFAEAPLRDGLYERLSQGVCLLLIGLVKKVILADGAAVIADPVFAAAAAGRSVAMADAWLGGVAFSLQLYFDFSGYSDMAIGLALMLGLRLPVNFNSPYHAASLREFWRRWHLTLSYWLRDYIYISLGGSRKGFARQLSVLFLTMILCGLWHGAGWTFVAWGALHGAGLGVNVIWRKLGLRFPKALGWAMTMLFVLFGWVLFRAESFGAFETMVLAMAGAGDVTAEMARFRPHFLLDRFRGDALRLTMAVVYLLPGVLVLMGPSSQRLVFDYLRPRRIVALGAGATLALVVLQAAGGHSGQFIYFEF